MTNAVCVIDKNTFDSAVHWDMLTEEDEKEIHEFYYANGWISYPYTSQYERAILMADLTYLSLKD
jgi:hypothetical protein